MSSDINLTPIWGMASSYGLKTIVVNVPLSYPPIRYPRSIVISGMHAPSIRADFVHPRTMMPRILDSGYMIDADPLTYDRLGYARLIMQMLEARINLTERLLDEEAYDLFILVLVEPDRIQHQFMVHTDVRSTSAIKRPYDPIFSVYKRIDEFIERLLREDSNLLVVSDHGFQPVKRYFHINEWMRKNGFLEVSPKTVILSRVSKASLGNALAQRLRSSVVRVLREKGTVDLSQSTVMRINPSRTLAWSFSDQGLVAINRISTESDGIVADGDVDSVAANLENGLLKVEDPLTHERVIRNVFRGKRVYSGPRETEAPDIIVEPSFGYMFSNSMGGPLFESVTFTDSKGTVANHELQGIILGCGPDISHSKKTNHHEYSILDVAPTALRLLNLPVPSYFDGVAIDELSSERTTQIDSTINFIDSPKGVPANLTPNDERLINERLKSLGYL